MPGIQALCGLDCGECEAFLATQDNDEAGLEAAARKWTADYGRQDLTAEMCICDGCSSGKRLSTAHAASCKLRLCASSRGVQTCAHCSDYACETLQGFFAFAPTLRDRLEAVRSQLGN
jgi:hypothetical protein